MIWNRHEDIKMTSKWFPPIKFPLLSPSIIISLISATLCRQRRGSLSSPFHRWITFLLHHIKDEKNINKKGKSYRKYQISYMCTVYKWWPFLAARNCSWLWGQFLVCTIMSTLNVFSCWSHCGVCANLPPAIASPLSLQPRTPSSTWPVPKNTHRHTHCPLISPALYLAVCKPFQPCCVWKTTARWVWVYSMYAAHVCLCVSVYVKYCIIVAMMQWNSITAVLRSQCCHQHWHKKRELSMLSHASGWHLGRI